MQSRKVLIPLMDIFRRLSKPEIDWLLFLCLWMMKSFFTSFLMVFPLNMIPSTIRTRSDVLSVKELNVLLNAEERVIKKRSNTVDLASMAMAAKFHSQGFQQGRGGRNNNQRGRGRDHNHNSGGGSHYGGGSYSNPNQFQNFNSSNFNPGNSGFSPQFQTYNQTKQSSN